VCDWQSKTDISYRCGVPSLPGSNLCILHSPDAGKDVEEFRRQLYKQLDEEGTIEARNERFRFDGYVFPREVVCQDDRDVDHPLVLPKQLEKRVSFTQATFKLDADFEGATFEGAADFRGATFMGNAFFGEAVFKRSAFFEGATFEEDTDFREATFKGYAFFEGATFEGHAFFWEATFEEDTDFRGATFKGFAFFGEATFERSAFFERATFQGDAGFGEATFGGYANFEFSDARNLYLGEQCPRVNALFGNKLGLRRMSREAGPSFWAFVRRTFETIGERERADAAYYLEKVWGRWAAMRGDRRDRIEGWLSYPVDLLLRWSIAYGTSFQRTVMSWLAVVLGFGTVYAVFPHVLGRQPDCIWTLFNWAAAIFASGSCFAKLSLAAREVIPAVGKALLLSESIIGSVLVALTVAVITRKVMR